MAHGGRFFRDLWSVFDFSVVTITLVPAAEGFAVLRTLRVLRALRLISAVPRMRLVVWALLSATPGISSIFALLLLIFYVAAVMATKLFGGLEPEWFGSIDRSFFTLFQIMTLAGVEAHSTTPDALFVTLPHQPLRDRGVLHQRVVVRDDIP
jgi:voltage-gated sodium channel